MTIWVETAKSEKLIKKQKTVVKEKVEKYLVRQKIG